MNYNIKSLEEIFEMDELKGMIERELETMDLEPGQREWNVVLLSDCRLGRYQTKRLIELFTDLEIEEEDYDDMEKNSLYHEELDYHIIPKIEDKLNEEFDEILPEGYILGVNYQDDTWLAIIAPE